MISNILSLLPKKTRERVFYRFLNNRQKLFPRDFKRAKLAYAPGLVMSDLLVGDVISGSIAFTGFYELELSRQLKVLARKGGLFVDVGANLGYFSLLWLAGNVKNHVVAIESSPRNQKAFEINMRANGLNGRWRLLASAAGHENREVAFNVGPVEQTGWGGISPEENGSDVIKVDMQRLDTLLPDIEIAVLKVDVEGADTWVLYGCEELLKGKKISRIYFEQHHERMASLGIQPGHAEAFLNRFGYFCRSLGGREWLALAPNVTSQIE